MRNFKACEDENLEVIRLCNNILSDFRGAVDAVKCG